MSQNSLLETKLSILESLKFELNIQKMQRDNLEDIIELTHAEIDKVEAEITEIEEEVKNDKN